MSATAKPSFPMPPMTAEHQATQKVAARLVELCSAGRNMEALHELYADSARHIEVMDSPMCPRILEGKQRLIEKAEQFERTTTVHSHTCGTPIVNGEQFIVTMTLDCTASEGPMAHQRMNMSETALYTVRNGKITEGRFFYSCGA